ncbi:hypothetical protein TD95_002321 [Thielaviopsis punctulata]|uniref:CID domain-containing protein n=1 Tax=Thielaviopsis punctulata TaxID=72032 RepID=A0A0F4ZCX7_9PEZI|nr:hypothetical protein TD95_002321 [Thielaviopsis punctulata]
MADPFEVRVRFTQMLSGLNASNTASQKAAQYLLKHKSMSEDLHSCIIEQVEHINNMNTRANILCFIEVFFDLAAKEPQSHDYLSMLQRDIISIVKSVTPCDALGHINLTIAKLVLSQVVQNLQRKGHIPEPTIAEIHEWFATHENTFSSNPLALPVATATATPPEPDENDVWAPRMSRKHAEERIEEDRERHKRLRENIWAVPSGPGEKLEWERVWEETSDLGDDDYGMAKEEAEERAGVVAEYCEHWREKLDRREDVVMSV